MPRIVNIDAETGDLSEWSTVDDTGSHATAAGAAAMGGCRWGFNFNIVGSDQIALRKTINWSTRTIRGRFYFDPNGISLADAVTRVIGSLWNATDGAVMRVFFQDSGGFFVALEYQQDGGGTTNTAFVAITDAQHIIEFEITRASSATAGDGSVRLWVDGVLEDTDTGLAIYTLGRPTEVRLQWDTNNNAADSGDLHFDELVVNNDGNPIGAKWLGTILTKESFDGGLAHLSQQALGGRIAAEASGALAGSRLGITLDAGAAGVFVGEVFAHHWTTDVLRWRFHLNVNNVSLNDVNPRRVFGIWDAGFSAVMAAVEIKDDGGHQIRAYATEDGSTSFTSYYSIAGSADYHIEVEIVRASSAVASDGTMKLWISGALQETVTGLDIYDANRADGWLIEWAGGDAGDSGSVYFDELEIRDKARLIGSAVKAERGLVSCTMDGVGYDYIQGTGNRQDSFGASPGTYTFESYDRPPDGDPDVTLTITWQDEAGNVNRSETFFAGKIIKIKQRTLEPPRVSRWTITVADNRHHMARTLLTLPIQGQQRADQAVTAALSASGLTAAGWTLDADEGPQVDPQDFVDVKMNTVPEHYAKVGGMLYWVTEKVVHLKLPETLQSPHEIDRENVEHWFNHDYDEDRGKIINWIKGTGDGNFQAAISQDAASQAEYGLRPDTVHVNTSTRAKVYDAINVILAARKNPLLEGSVQSDYDRLSIGDNTIVTDLDRGLKDVPVRISGLNWTEGEYGRWQIAVTLTNDTVMAALVITGKKVNE